MKRTKFVETLARVQPALSTKDFIPVFSCFCFKDGKVFAYNDIIALRAPVDTDMEGGVRGKVLLDFMKASTADEVDLTPGTGGVQVKSGMGSKIKMPIVPVEDFIFEFPAYESGASNLELDLSRDVMAAFRRCSISMGYDPAHPWRLGVTVKFSPGKLTMYSSDNVTMARSVADAEHSAADDSTIVLPPRFCELLITLGARDTPLKLYVSDNYIIATFKDGTELFAKTVGEANLQAFELQFQTVEEGKSIQTVALPMSFSPALDRALVVLAADPDKHARLTVSEGQLAVYSKSNYGEVNDQVALPEHEDLAVRCAPELMRRGLDYIEGMAILNNQCVYFDGDTFTYLVAVVAE